MDRSEIYVRNSWKHVRAVTGPRPPRCEHICSVRYCLTFGSYNKNHAISPTSGILHIKFRELSDRSSFLITHKPHLIYTCNYLVLKRHADILCCSVSDILLFGLLLFSFLATLGKRLEGGAGVWARKQKDGDHLEETGANGKVI
jgi:hypothetical protein